MILPASRAMDRPIYCVFCSTMSDSSDDSIELSETDVLETSYPDDGAFGLTLIEEGVHERRKWFERFCSEPDLNARIREVLDSSSFNQRVTNV